jgi:His/Glu/Gln/Arg/opine family amino acid ABC transporter permease subunit
MLEYFNFRVIAQYLDQYLIGLLATGWISLVSIFLALILGTIACVMRLSKNRLISSVSAVYIESIRSTPLLTQLYFFYFGLPSIGININEVQTGILALSLNSGAYIAEIIRAGILSVPRGHIEAGIASGLSFIQRLRYIILPQALGVVVPPLLGSAIVLVKDSSLLSLISVLELTRAGQILTSERFMPAEGFFTTAVFYLVIYAALKVFSDWAQKKLIFREAH